MRFRLSLTIVIVLAGLSMSAQCWARYSIGLALPAPSKPSDPQLARDVKRALELFTEQLKGPLGGELKEEFGVDPPELTFKTILCPARDIPCAKRTAQDFVKSDCVAVIGHTYSGPALAAGKVYDRHRMVLVAPTATHREVAKVSNRVFTLTFNDEWQGAVIAAYVYRMMKRSRVAVLYEESAYGRGLRESFLKQAQSMGLQPLAEIAVPMASSQDRTPDTTGLLSKLDSADVIVLFAGRNTAIKVFRQVRKHKIDVPIVGSDSLLSTSFADAVRRTIGRLKQPQANVLVASPFFYELAPLKAHEFERLYEKRFSDRGWRGADHRFHPQRSDIGLAPYPALFVDAALLITRGIMTGLAKGSRSVGDMRTTINTYFDGIDSPEKAVEGITGRLYFNEEGSMPRPVLFGWLQGSGFRPAFLQLARVPATRTESPDESTSNAGGRQPGWKPLLVNGVPVEPKYVVFTGINLYRIDNVDLLSQSFDAEFFLWFRWKKPKNLVLNGDTIFFWNSVYSIDDQVVPMGSHVGSGIHYKSFRLKGGFLDTYDLRNYPFDTQVFTLRMSLPAYGTDRILLAVDHEVENASDDFRIFPNEYKKIGSVDHASGTLPLNATLGDPRRQASRPGDYDYSVYQVRFRVARNPFPYLLKMFMPIFLLIGICLAVFWVPARHFGVRMTLVMTSLLSAIVFHMSRASRLPNVGYLTLADTYFVVSYVVMSASIAANIWIEWLVQKGQQSRSETLNSGARYLLSAGTVFAFLTLALPAIRTWQLRAFVGVGILFSGWLVYEFVRLHPSVRARVSRFLPFIREKRDEVSGDAEY
jgi:branched-chain amino acid transport system substrate-binding protein